MITVQRVAAMLIFLLVAANLKQKPLGDHELWLQGEPELKSNVSTTSPTSNSQSFHTSLLDPKTQNHTTTTSLSGQGTGEELPSLSSKHGRRRKRRRKPKKMSYLGSLLSKFNAKTMEYWDTEILKEKPLTLPQVQATVVNTRIARPYGAHQIERIYYNNMGKNGGRKEFTNSYLGRLKANTGVPFQRLEAKRGDNDVCIPSKSRGDQCIGTSGIAYSLLHILNHENVTGPTIVLEDDYFLNDENFDRLYAAMDMLPDDWDIVRFDCWGMDFKEFASVINPYVVNTTTYTVSEECNRPCTTGFVGGHVANTTIYASSDKCNHPCTWWFAGGAYAMLWRGRPSSVEKLKKTLSMRPFTDVDGRMGMDGHRFGLVSYCMNIGLGTLIQIPNEITDIPKLQVPEN